MSPAPRVVVTGVGGLIGSHVARQALAAGARVVGCDSFVTGQRRNVPADLELRELDCRDVAAMRGLCRGAEVVIHCAAAPYEGLSVYSPHFVADHNFGASAAVFSGAIAAGVGRVVFTSSMARYGRGPLPFVEEQAPEPVDPYGVSKVAAEMLLRSLGELHGLRWVVGVPHNVVGPGQRYDDVYRNVAALMVNRVLAGERPVVYGDGQQRRSFTHVADVAEQLWALATRDGVAGQVFNLGSDTGFITINELVRLVLSRTGVEGSPRYLPARPGEVRDATCSHARIEELLGGRSERSLDDALDALIAEVRAQGPRPLRPDLPLEISDARVPAPWLAEPVKG
ncbi:MAG: NAD-dependent epimerase/dehydratase family protein [Myxococcales bacterium]|nr:NAD-dependent epimerase/dehydratase family protein [Myxococcales bacterium]